MKFRGTPGPWKAITTGKHWNNSALENIQVQFGYAGECICDTVYVREDANLISAAPELLEQLIRLRDIVANYLPEDDDHLDIVDAAINKALGSD